jgi:hypothetical protein
MRQKIYRDQRTVSVATTDSPLAPANGHRKSILISCPPTNRISLAFGQAAVLDQGITLFPGERPFLMDRNDFG